MPFESGPQTTKTAIWGGITFVRKKQWRLFFKWACKFHSILGSFHFFPKEILPCLFKIILISQIPPQRKWQVICSKISLRCLHINLLHVSPEATSLQLPKLREKIFLHVNNPELCFSFNTILIRMQKKSVLFNFWCWKELVTLRLLCLAALANDVGKRDHGIRQNRAQVLQFK